MYCPILIDYEHKKIFIQILFLILLNLITNHVTRWSPDYRLSHFHDIYPSFRSVYMAGFSLTIKTKRKIINLSSSLTAVRIFPVISNQDWHHFLLEFRSDCKNWEKKTHSLCKHFSAKGHECRHTHTQPKESQERESILLLLFWSWSACATRPDHRRISFRPSRSPDFYYFLMR